MIAIPSIYYLFGVGCSSSAVSWITSPYVVWGPIAALAAILVLAVLGIVFQLSTVIGRNDLRAWVRIKAFDTFFGLILIVVFLSVATMVCSISPVNALSQAGLVQGGLSFNGQNFNCNASGSTLYDVALCDLAAFNDAVIQLNSGIFAVGVAFASSPLVSVSFNLTQGLGVGFQGFSLAPTSVDQNIGGVVATTYTLLILSNVQLLLLASSVLIFAVFMAIGLIARLFGVTRSFGGAMIAFAIGIGIVYPMLVSVTYGFVLHALKATGGGFATLVGFFTAAGLFSQLIGGFIGPVYSTIIPLIIGLVGLYNLQSAVLYVGFTLLGLTFVPFLNFMILDAFIVDFSQAIGERMDFLSLLGSLL